MSASCCCVTAGRARGRGVVAAWGLAVCNGVFIAPKSQAALGRLQDRLKASQASFEIQPRVFYEGFPKLVLYVQDVKSAEHAAVWKGVFIADISTPSAPRITLAQQGILIAESPDTLHLHLSNGATHESDTKNPDAYQISTFQQTDIPIHVPQVEDKQDQDPVPVAELGTSQLLEQAHKSKKFWARFFLIEFTAGLHCRRPVWCWHWWAYRWAYRRKKAANPPDLC